MVHRSLCWILAFLQILSGSTVPVALCLDHHQTRWSLHAWNNPCCCDLSSCDPHGCDHDPCADVCSTPSCPESNHSTNHPLPHASDLNSVSESDSESGSLCACEPGCCSDSHGACDSGFREPTAEGERHFCDCTMCLRRGSDGVALPALPLDGEEDSWGPSCDCVHVQLLPTLVASAIRHDSGRNWLNRTSPDVGWAILPLTFAPIRTQKRRGYADNGLVRGRAHERLLRSVVLRC